MLASWVTTLKDLGLPSLAGAVVGAIIAHYTAKARGREEDQRSRARLLLQDERKIALEMLASIRDIQRKLVELDSVATPPTMSFGQLHNEWSDQILAPARVVRSAELDRRARAGAYVLFLATLPQDVFLSWALMKAGEDVERWLEAWLKDEEPPPAQVPPMDELRHIVNNNGRLDVGRLEAWFQEQWRQRNT